MQYFRGRKEVVLTTLTWFGGQNHFLPIAYLVTSSLTLLIAIVLTVVWIKFGKNGKSMLVQRVRDENSQAAEINNYWAALNGHQILNDVHWCEQMKDEEDGLEKNVNLVQYHNNISRKTNEEFSLTSGNDFANQLNDPHVWWLLMWWCCSEQLLWKLGAFLLYKHYLFFSKHTILFMYLLIFIKIILSHLQSQRC